MGTNITFEIPSTYNTLEHQKHIKISCYLTSKRIQIQLQDALQSLSTEEKDTESPSSHSRLDLQIANKMIA